MSEVYRTLSTIECPHSLGTFFFREFYLPIVFLLLELLMLLEKTLSWLLMVYREER